MSASAVAVAAAADDDDRPSSSAPIPPTETFRIGIVGGGVVGGGVYELIANLNAANANPASASSSSSSSPAVRIEIAKMCVRDASKPRDFFTPNESSSLLTTNPDDILNDPAIDCVVEVMGGVVEAKRIVESALRRGKYVVTANKALLAEYLDSLNDLSVSNNAPLGYEAAVCGGIPIIHLLRSSCHYAPHDRIKSVTGICNGTTNFMLERMQQTNATFDEALKEAQQLGFAEADPTADVEGHDVLSKLCLLSKLAFGTTIRPREDVLLRSGGGCKGITQMATADFENARLLSCTVKLIGTTELSLEKNSKKVVVYVTPTLVPLQSDSGASSSSSLSTKCALLAYSANGSGNVVVVQSSNLQTSAYVGLGAGRYPTANSVVADIVRFAKAKAAAEQSPSSSSTIVEPPFPLQTRYESETDYESGTFYVRATVTVPATEDDTVEENNGVASGEDETNPKKRKSPCATSASTASLPPLSSLQSLANRRGFDVTARDKNGKEIGTCTGGGHDDDDDIRFLLATTTNPDQNVGGIKSSQIQQFCDDVRAASGVTTFYMPVLSSTS